jgi:hypothetical protein
MTIALIILGSGLGWAFYRIHELHYENRELLRFADIISKRVIEHRKRLATQLEALQKVADLSGITVEEVKDLHWGHYSPSNPRIAVYRKGEVDPSVNSPESQS